jgi:hypothetical protein
MFAERPPSRPVTHDAAFLLNRSAESLQDHFEAPFAAGEIVRVAVAPYAGDPAQVVHVDRASGLCTVKLYPRLDYASLLAPGNRAPAAGRAPLAAFDPAFFGELRIPLQRTRVKLGDLVHALEFDGRTGSGPFEYVELAADALFALEPGSLSAAEKARFRGHVAEFERRLPRFAAAMERSLQGPDRAPGAAPALLRGFSAALPPRFAAVDGELLEEAACRARCGARSPSFAQLHSRRRLLTAVDPNAMLDFMERAAPCVAEFRDAAPDGAPARARAEQFAAELAELGRLCLADRDTGAESIRKIQTAYFNRFLPLMDDVRKDEVRRVQEEEAARKLPPADWFLPPPDEAGRAESANERS